MAWNPKNERIFKQMDQPTNGKLHTTRSCYVVCLKLREKMAGGKERVRESTRPPR